MPVSDVKKLDRQFKYDRRISEASGHIPTGSYCYSLIPRDQSPEKSKVTHSPMPAILRCKFYKTLKSKPDQRNGYCRLLKAGDWMPHPHGTMLLWDGCKECGINTEISDETT